MVGRCRGLPFFTPFLLRLEVFALEVGSAKAEPTCLAVPAFCNRTSELFTFVGISSRLSSCNALTCCFLASFVSCNHSRHQCIIGTFHHKSTGTRHDQTCCTKADLCACLHPTDTLGPSNFSRSDVGLTSAAECDSGALIDEMTEAMAVSANPMMFPVGVLASPDIINIAYQRSFATSRARHPITHRVCASRLNDEQLCSMTPMPER